jgi:hypothetical protein
VQLKQQRLSHADYSINVESLHHETSIWLCGGELLKYQSNSRRREIALNKRTDRHDMVAYRRWNG